MSKPKLNETVMKETPYDYLRFYRYCGPVSDAYYGSSLSPEAAS
jgi:hypothetical protein